MLEEMVDRHLNEYSRRLHRKDSSAVSIARSLCFGEDSAPGLPGDPRMDTQLRGHGYGLAELNVQAPSNSRHSEEPVETAEDFVQRRCQHTPVRQAGRPLMEFTHLKFSENFHARTGNDPQVQAGWVIGPTANTPAVVRGDRGAGFGCSGRPDGDLRPIGWTGATHEPAHYPALSIQASGTLVRCVNAFFHPGGFSPWP
jgi:hypothetical protein